MHFFYNENEVRLESIETLNTNNSHRKWKNEVAWHGILFFFVFNSFSCIRFLLLSKSISINIDVFLNICCEC